MAGAGKDSDSDSETPQCSLNPITYKPYVFPSYVANLM